MRVGDIEYTRKVVARLVGATSEVRDVQFALGIKVRPLLVRTQTSFKNGSAVSESGGAFFENSQGIGAGTSVDALIADELDAIPLLVYGKRLVTSGFQSFQGPVELLHWKILMPQVRLHFVGFTTDEWSVELA
ncbi:hypothetical protein LCGC14_3085750, partial [marine sediment metagenome]